MDANLRPRMAVLSLVQKQAYRRTFRLARPVIPVPVGRLVHHAVPSFYRGVVTCLSIFTSALLTARSGLRLPRQGQPAPRSGCVSVCLHTGYGFTGQTSFTTTRHLALAIHSSAWLAP